MRFRTLHTCAFVLGVILLWLAGRHFLGEHGPKVRFTEVDSARIKDGMTQAEVEKTLGVPAGDYRSRFAVRNSDPLMQPSTDEDSFTKEWISDDGLIAVDFTKEGKVKCALFGTVAPARMSLFDRIRILVGF